MNSICNNEVQDKSKQSELTAEQQLNINTAQKQKEDTEEFDTSDEENTTNENKEHSSVSKESTDNASQDYDPKDFTYEGDIAVYTDSKTGYQYQWDVEKNEWVPKSDVNYGYEDDTHVYTDSDGVKFFWDEHKKAWFPKVDDDFMARYQMNYGFTDDSSSGQVKAQIKEQIEAKSKQQDEEKPKAPPAKKAKRNPGEKRKASDPTWFELDETENTAVYVSNLPTDLDEQEFVDFMQKCGLVMKDPNTQKFKIKLYKESGTEYLKGDALCTYIKIESVDLALNLLDGYDLKGKKVRVERAKFQLKGEYDPKLKPKMRRKKDKQKLRKQQEKLFDWRPEKKIGERAKHEKVVIVKNLFEPSLFDKDVGLILEFQQDLREEAGKIGEVRKVMIYDRHPEGVAQINMSNPEEADQVVSMLNGRYFMQRQLSAEIWDGKSKYKIQETDSQISKRLDGWDKFLEGDDSETIEKKTENPTEQKQE